MMAGDASVRRDRSRKYEVHPAPAPPSTNRCKGSQRICARSAGCRLFYSVVPLALVWLALRIYMIGKFGVFHVISKLYVCLRDAQHGRPLGWIVRLLGHPNPGNGVFSIFLGRTHVGERSKERHRSVELPCRPLFLIVS
jgi:hypothetical protein